MTPAQLEELKAAAELLKHLLETTWTGEDSPDTLQLPRFDDKRFYIAAKKYMPALLDRLADLERLREAVDAYDECDHPTTRREVLAALAKLTPKP